MCRGASGIPLLERRCAIAWERSTERIHLYIALGDCGFLWRAGLFLLRKGARLRLVIYFRLCGYIRELSAAAFGGVVCSTNRPGYEWVWRWRRLMFELDLRS